MVDFSAAVLKLVLAVSNLAFVLVNLVLAVTFGYYVTRLAHSSTSVLVIQLTLVGMVFVFAGGLYITVKRKFLLLKVYSIVLAAFVVLQVLSVVDLASGGAKEVFETVVGDMCATAKGAAMDSGSGALSAEAGWVCCCPATCDPTSELWMKSIVSPDVAKASRLAAWKYNSVNVSEAQSFLKELTAYQLWKWPLISCPVENNRAVTQFGEDSDHKPVGAAALKNGLWLAKLASWMHGEFGDKPAVIAGKASYDHYWSYEITAGYNQIQVPVAGPLPQETVKIRWCESGDDPDHKEEDNDGDLTSDAPCGRGLGEAPSYEGLMVDGDAKAQNKGFQRGLWQCNPNGKNPGCGKPGNPFGERKCKNEEHPHCYSNVAANTGQTCKDRDSCLTAFIHKKTSTFEKFVAVLILFLVLEACMVYGTWVLGTKHVSSTGEISSVELGGDAGSVGSPRTVSERDNSAATANTHEDSGDMDVSLLDEWYDDK